MSRVKRVLVTGASGFLGDAGVRALIARGFEVHGTGRGAAPDLPGLVWHPADLLTEAGRAQLVAAARPSHLLHLAWEARPGLYRDSPDNPAWAAASLDLLDRALASGTERVLGIGTCFEYGPYDGLCVEGVTPCGPATLYGQAKLAAAEGFAAAARSGAGVAWGRVFFPFGPGEPAGRLIPALIRSLAEGEDFACSHGGQLRDFIYVEDLADAMIAVLDGTLTGTVNLGSGEPQRLRDIIGSFARRLGREDLVRYGARGVSGADAEPIIAADIARLRDEAGWTPPVGWAEGVERSLAWWRSRRAGATV
ncbi:MAG: NAD(P)-dependent oxidoreductase [Aliidongia sp.]